MNYPENCRYTESHEWVRMDSDEVLIGITDFAQGELGDVVYVELPEVGTEMAVGDECGMIDSAKTTSPLIIPLNGTIVRVNEKLADHPELVNECPYDEGWMFAVEPENPKELERLMTAEEYKTHVQQS